MPKATKHIEVKPSKYKTSLCQYFTKNVECPYGERCVFAHGEHELQSEEENIALLKSTGLARLDRGVPNNANNDTDKIAIRDKNRANNMEPLFVLSESDNDLSGSDSNQSSLSSNTEQLRKEHDCLKGERLQQESMLHRAERIELQFPCSPACINSVFGNKLSTKLLRRRPVMVSLPKFDTTCETGTSPYESTADTILTKKSRRISEFCTASDNNNIKSSNDTTNVARAADTVTEQTLPSCMQSDTKDENAKGDDVQKAGIETKMEWQLCTKRKNSRHNVCRSSWQSTHCACAFSATCARDRPTVYRHNPYLIC